MKLGKKLKSLWAKLVEKAKAWVAEQERAADAARQAVLEGAGEDIPAATDNPHDAAYPTAVPWDKCRYSSNWDNGAAKRLMNILSPKFDDKKFGDYLAWIVAQGCDHCHVIFVNGGDGEGSGYDCLTDASVRELALKRVRTIRGKGLGVVGWIVSDDSDSDRRKIFGNPAKYAEGLKPFLPYLSYIVIGLEMDEKLGDEQIPVAKWKSLRDAVKSAGWTGKFGTHHTSGKHTYASLGEIVCDQLDPNCTASQIKSSVKALRDKGYAVCGFEYSRDPDRSRSLAALDAGAFSVGNWAGGDKSVSTAPSQEKEADGNGSDACSVSSAPDATAHDDAVDFSLLDWRWGGFNGAKATISPARIRGLKVGSGSLSYSWERGSCSDLDAACTHDKPCCTCALFCLVDGKWVGGNFEHVSTDRTSRGLGNVQEGYGGWDPSALSRAEAYAFVILDDGAKRRTNVITCGR